MGTTVKNAESAVLRGQARYKAWLEKHMAEWSQPYTDAMIVAWWGQVPEPIKAQLRAQKPEVVRDFEQRIKALRGG